MLLVIVLNVACACVLVGGWALAVSALYRGLGGQPAPAARLLAQRRPRADRLRDAVVPVRRAA